MKCTLFVLVMGNTGTGKSTFIRKLEQRISRKVIINDTFTEDNSTPNLSIAILRALNEFDQVILEGNYMSREIRSFIGDLKIQQPKTTFLCIDFGPGDDESLKRRIIDTNHTPEKVIDIHISNNREYAKPNEEEGFEKIITRY